MSSRRPEAEFDFMKDIPSINRIDHGRGLIECKSAILNSDRNGSATVA